VLIKIVRQPSDDDQYQYFSRYRMLANNQQPTTWSTIIGNLVYNATGKLLWIADKKE
jgi:hypothetical protein